MKVICFPKICALIICLTWQSIYAQVDTLTIDNTFTHINLNEFANRIGSSTELNIDKAVKSSLPFKNQNPDFAFFDIDEEFGYLSFSITNASLDETRLMVEIYNALLNEVSFYEKRDESYVLINRTGTDFPFNSRLKNDRNFLYPIILDSKQSKSFVFQFRKSKISIVVPAKIWTEKAFQKSNKLQYLIIGLYYGLCFISILISLYIFIVLKEYIYLLYSCYIVFLGLYLLSYLGLFFQYFCYNDAYYNKYIHVVFAVFSLILFLLFSMKVLKGKDYAPKLTKVLVGFIIVTVLIRFAEFYLPSDFFHNVKAFIIRFWYLSFFVSNLILILIIWKSYQNQKKITLFYAVAYSFVGLGTIVTVLNLSYGNVNAFIIGLPIIFFGSLLEIVFLTFTIIFMVKEIYDERNVLSEKVVAQQKGFLSAFMKGEDRERERISRELHDNIGSQLGYLKRFVSDKFSDAKINETIDTICNDVRNLSHEISPSDLKLIGFESAVSELSKSISSQTSINVTFNSYEFPGKLKELIATQLYRVVQESFNNVIKHSDAQNIDIQLIGFKNYATISIEDDGNGFDPVNSQNGLGIKNMNSRIQQIQGALSIDSQLGVGTCILISFPLD